MNACAGVDGCKGGWITVWRKRNEDPQAAVFNTFSGLLENLPSDAIIAVDIPIGLPDRIEGTGRAAEQAVRKLLPGKTSSVFSVPSREAVEKGQAYLSAHPYKMAYLLTKDVARATSHPPKALSRQAFGILPKIAEVDALLRADTSLHLRLWESHPEAAFCFLNQSRPMSSRKSTDEGAKERRAVLAVNGIDPAFLALSAPSGAKTDDFLDACAMLATAEPILAGNYVTHPSTPERDRHNLPIAIATPA